MREDNQTFCDTGSSKINLKLNLCCHKKNFGNRNDRNFEKEENNYFIKRRRKEENLIEKEEEKQQNKLINNRRINNLKLKNEREDNLVVINRIKRRNSIFTNFYSNTLIFITFGAFLALFAFISAVEGSNTKSNEIDVDWTLGTTTG
uniref:Uncharacterized protein n=1 Tax=Meloidogyne enterolobii TaxID=390850 RepID=A0A6V7U9K6_MELEN|nr:unnamed protein product [Meloidogyne enterolobii]